MKVHPSLFDRGGLLCDQGLREKMEKAAASALASRPKAGNVRI